MEPSKQNCDLKSVLIILVLRYLAIYQFADFNQGLKTIQLVIVRRIYFNKLPDPSADNEKYTQEMELVKTFFPTVDNCFK